MEELEARAADSTPNATANAMSIPMPATKPVALR